MSGVMGPMALPALEAAVVAVLRAEVATGIMQVEQLMEPPPTRVVAMALMVAAQQRQLGLLALLLVVAAAAVTVIVEAIKKMAVPVGRAK